MFKNIASKDYFGYSLSAAIHIALIAWIALGVMNATKIPSLDAQSISIDMIKIDKITQRPEVKKIAKPEKGKSTVFNSKTIEKKAPTKKISTNEIKPSTSQKPQPDLNDDAIALKASKKKQKEENKKPKSIPAATLKQRPEIINSPTPTLKLKPDLTLNLKMSKNSTKKDAFEDVVKAVEDLREKALDFEKDKQAKKQVPQEKSTPDAKEMTINEKEAVLRQLAMCWTPPAGVKEAESIVVTITVELDKTAHVIKANLADPTKASTDPVYRVAAEAALRSLNHPACTPLLLPKEKYDVWKSMTINFDPRMMF